MKRSKGEMKPLLSFTLWHCCMVFPCPGTSRGALAGKRHFRLPGEGELSCVPLSLPPRNWHTKSSQNHNSYGIA